jgi:hypothetical protein
MDTTSQKYEYETVPGYFFQDDPSTNPNTFDYARHFPTTHPQAPQV